MIKRTFFYVALTTIIFTSCQSNEYDTRAIDSLDKLSETIGNLNSCSYTLNTFKVQNDSTEIVNQSDIYMRGPDKMYIHIVGTKGDKGYWYNGTSFAYLLYENNEYDIIDAPDNILKVIDKLHNEYGIDFPAADFFYPSLTDDIMDEYNSVLFAEEEIDGVSCSLIEATNDEEILQIWIEKETNLPYRMFVESKANENKSYDAVFSNWRINPNLPDLLFEFQPSENSTKVELQSNN